MRRTLWPSGAPIGETLETDVVVVGCGMAGLYTALNIDESLRCLLVTKEDVLQSNSWLAQGGIAAAISRDDTPTIHFDDTLAAGAGLCDEAAVSVLVDEGPAAIADLVSRQVPFDLDEAGELEITREGGHTRNRIVHAGGDATGRETVKVLAAIARTHPNIRILQRTFLVDITTHEGTTDGVLLYRDDGFLQVAAAAVVLCSGGIGQVYGNRTTNPAVATGEGLAAAVRAGATARHMEFIQFHPTALYDPAEEGSAFLISEALRGEGALLRNIHGERYMDSVHPMAELAPRDIVARANTREMLRTHSPHVFLDITMKPYDVLATRFPTIVGHCLRRGLDISHDYIPVRPVQHYLMGGLATDLYGQTMVPGLYACGEVASTGVHGANRLASNSMLECLVFGRRAARHINDNARPPVLRPIQDRTAPLRTLEIPPELLRARIVQTANRCAGVIRTTQGLTEGCAELGALVALLETAELPTQAHWETFGLATVAQLILEAALQRKESVGAHYREDVSSDDALQTRQ